MTNRKLRDTGNNKVTVGMGTGIRNLTFLLLYALFILLSGCDLPNQPGPQPSDIIETDFAPGLNVLGVLRLDGSSGSSFIRVERAYLIEETDTVERGQYFSPVVPDAQVQVQGTADTALHVFSFVEDSVHGSIYANDSFFPHQGERYWLTVTAPGLPELTATTTIPAEPSIDSTSLVVSDRSVSFDLLATADIDLYDVFLVSPDDTLHQRIVGRNDERIPIRFDFSPVRGQTMSVETYGYDANLAEYLTASITIKPQTYQETLTTVVGGYGCFGSVSKATVFIGGR